MLLISLVKFVQELLTVVTLMGTGKPGDVLPILIIVLGTRALIGWALGFLLRAIAKEGEESISIFCVTVAHNKLTTKWIRAAPPITCAQPNIQISQPLVKQSTVVGCVQRGGGGEHSPPLPCPYHLLTPLTNMQLLPARWVCRYHCSAVFSGSGREECMQGGGHSPALPCPCPPPTPSR
jgi:hypothetical protein